MIHIEVSEYHYYYTIPVLASELPSCSQLPNPTVPKKKNLIIYVRGRAPSIVGILTITVINQGAYFGRSHLIRWPLMFSLSHASASVQ